MNGKQFSVDYWVDPVGVGDPDSSDFSDDLNALRRIIKSREREFGKYILYSRVNDDPREIRNWHEIETIVVG